MGHYYESCFSNIEKTVGAKVSSGWDTLAVSDDLPSELYTICRELQSKNCEGLNKISEEVLQSGQWEIEVAQNHLFYNHTQYGLTDYHGRPNLFSHSLIFPEAKNLLANPNTFLTISSSTFAKNQDDLDSKNGLIYDEQMTFDTALELCQLNLGTLEKLLAAVYERISSDMIFEPLYIDCSDDRQKKALLYLIYSSLPLSLRPLLSLSSVKTPKVTTKQLVFDKEATKERYYFSLEAGAASILDDQVDFELPVFLKYPLSLSEEDKQNYFLNIERACHEMGMENTTEEVALRFCHNGIISQGEEDLLGRIKDGLRIGQRTPELDYYLAVLLKHFVAQGQFLGEYDEHFLTQCQNRTKVDELKEIATVYFTNTLLRLEQDQALAKLKDMDDSAIAVAEKHLSKSEAGKSLYHAFLSDYLSSKEVTSLEDLLEVTKGLVALPSHDLLSPDIITKSKDLFTKELETTSDSLEIANVYKTFKNVITLVSDDEGLLEDGQEVLLSLLKFDSFKLDKNSEDLLNSLTINDKRKAFYMDLLDLHRQLRTEKDSTCLNAQLTNFIDTNKKQRSYLNISPSQIISKILEFSTLSEHDKDWIVLINELNDADTKTSFDNLKDSLAGQNFNQFMTEYKDLITYPEESYSEQAKRTKLFAWLFKALSYIDAKEVVPLDIWLIVGRESHAHKTAIDEAKPRIFGERMVDIVSESTLLDDEAYLAYLKAYVKSKGKYSKIVAKLLKMQGKEDFGKAKPSFFKQLFSRKKKKESDEC